MTTDSDMEQLQQALKNAVPFNTSREGFFRDLARRMVLDYYSITNGTSSDLQSYISDCETVYTNLQNLDQTK